MYIERLIPNIPEAKKAGVWEKALGVGNCGHLEGRRLSMGMRGRELGERLTYGFGRDQESSEGRDSNLEDLINWR